MIISVTLELDVDVDILDFSFGTPASREDPGDPAEITYKVYCPCGNPLHLDSSQREYIEEIALSEARAHYE